LRGGAHSTHNSKGREVGGWQDLECKKKKINLLTEKSGGGGADQTFSQRYTKVKPKGSADGGNFPKRRCGTLRMGGNTHAKAGRSIGA